MVIYEKIFFLVFKVSRSNYYLYQLFDGRLSFLILRRSNLRGDILIILFWKKVGHLQILNKDYYWNIST